MLLNFLIEEKKTRKKTFALIITILFHKATNNKQDKLRVTFAQQGTGALEPDYKETGRPNLLLTFQALVFFFYFNGSLVLHISVILKDVFAL